MKQRYKIKDYYECVSGETVGYANTIAECKKIMNDYYLETDGECDLAVLELIVEKQKYDSLNPVQLRW